MLNGIDLRTFRSEFEKTAITRAAVEAQKALAAGDVGTVQDIGSAYRNLNLPARSIKQLHKGGVEAIPELVMGSQLSGKLQAPGKSGAWVAKYVQPNSLMARGEEMGKLIQQKSDATKAMRALPGGADLVPDMTSAQMNPGAPGLMQRHVVGQEWVPQAKSMGAVARKDPAAAQRMVGQVEKTLAGPMAAQGTPLMDIAKTTAKGIGGNTGSIVAGPDGKPKLVDFVPGTKNSPVVFKGEGIVPGLSPQGFSQAREGQSLSSVKREVHRPSQAFEPTSAATARSYVGQAPAATAAPGRTAVPAAAATKVVSPRPAAAAATKVVGPARATGLKLPAPTIPKAGIGGGLRAATRTPVTKKILGKGLGIAKAIL